MKTDVLGAHNFSEPPTVNEVELAVGPHTVLKAIPSAIAALSGTTTIPLSNSVPAINAGTQIWTQTISPTKASSTIVITGGIIFDCGTNGRILVVCLFRGNTCIGVTSMLVTTAARPVPISFTFDDVPGSTDPQTYSIRVGLNSGGTWYVNQTSTPYWAGLLAANGILTLELA